MLLPIQASKHLLEKNKHTNMDRLLLLLFMILVKVSLGFSNPSLLTVREGRDFALFFAASEYEEWGDLRNPISDAKQIAAVLSAEYGFDTVLFRNPDLETIINVLMGYQTRKFPEDAQLLIFFSGHGHYSEESSEGFFIPTKGRKNDRVMSTWLPYQRLKGLVDNIHCKHILLMIDACRSGTADERLITESFGRGEPLGKGDFGRIGDGEQTKRERYIYKNLKDTTRFLLTSGRNELISDGVKYSPFTEYFIKTLHDKKANEILTYWDLLAGLKSLVPTPHHATFGRHELGGNFLFFPANMDYTVRMDEPKPGEKETHDFDFKPVISEIKELLEFDKSKDYYIEKLSLAEQLGQGNALLPFTIGEAFDYLSQEVSILTNPEKAKGYRENAKFYYSLALRLVPDYWDANYNLGDLYYREAKSLSGKLNSSAWENEEKKELEEQIVMRLEKALPYFQKAERIDPNHYPTLVALQYIYRKKGITDISAEFENRIRAYQRGEKIKKSFFR